MNHPTPTLNELLAQIAQEVPGCLMTSVVDLDSGLALASVSHDSLAAAGADAYHADIYRALYRAASALEGAQHPEAVVLMSHHAVFLSVPFGGTTCFWHVVTRIDTTIGFTQALIRKYYHAMEQATRALTG
jgi:predicted regulator of Ras-like GTPase activity (Roadblock/LC7/MglB family)